MLKMIERDAMLKAVRNLVDVPVESVTRLTITSECIEYTEKVLVEDGNGNVDYLLREHTVHFIPNGY